jgi:hypothetical protein
LIGSNNSTRQTFTHGPTFSTPVLPWMSLWQRTSGELHDQD